MMRVAKFVYIFVANERVQAGAASEDTLMQYNIEQKFCYFENVLC